MASVGDPAAPSVPARRPLWRVALGPEYRWMVVLMALCLAVVAWQVSAAPPWKMDDPSQGLGVDLVAADGTTFAHRGANGAEPVDAAKLPDRVRQAFLAIEDRRFYSHGAVDLSGLARAMVHNVMAGGVVEGGSTITQQYVKNAYLEQDRTFVRKLKELFLADWAETWLSKDVILSRYLQHAYFGDQAYGLTSAARHYFAKKPEQLSLSEAAMLAGLVKAPSRLNPANDRKAAEARMRVVLKAMADAGFITAAQAVAAPSPRLRLRSIDKPEAFDGWFADWVSGQLDPGTSGVVQTTLDPQLQQRAEAVVRRAGLGPAEVALVAMRPDGRVVAMVGGKRYSPGGFNRVTQARRQPGSTFKLFDYLAAFRKGARPDDTVLDEPLTIDGWTPTNAYSGYLGEITLREAFARSSNLAAVRVSQAAGLSSVVQAARDLGVQSAMPDGPTVALGTGQMPLIELAQAYAAFAGGRYPVVAHGLTAQDAAPRRALDKEREWQPMLDLLFTAANEGTGRRAALAQPTFGKTGTSQDGRDALFVGFASDLVTAVWVGRDDNKPMPGSSGGHLPAQIWRAFVGGVPLEQGAIPWNEPAPEAAFSLPAMDDLYAGFEDLARGLPAVMPIASGGPSPRPSAGPSTSYRAPKKRGHGRGKRKHKKH